jgi:hypothetical protein
MSGHHLKPGVGSAESVRFVVGEESHSPRSFVDDPHPQVVWVPGRLLLKAGDLSRITRYAVRPHPGPPVRATNEVDGAWCKRSRNPSCTKKLRRASPIPLPRRTVQLSSGGPEKELLSIDVLAAVC